MNNDHPLDRLCSLIVSRAVFVADAELAYTEAYFTFDEDSALLDSSQDTVSLKLTRATPATATTKN